MKLKLKLRLICIIFVVGIFNQQQLFAQKNIERNPYIAECANAQLSALFGANRMENCIENFACDEAVIRDGYIYDTSQPMRCGCAAKVRP